MASVDYEDGEPILKFDGVTLGMAAGVGGITFRCHNEHFTSVTGNSASGRKGIFRFYHRQPGYFKVQKKEIIEKDGRKILQIELGPLEEIERGDGDVLTGMKPILAFADRPNLELKLEKIQINLADNQVVVITVLP